MRFDIISIFPNIFDSYFNESIIKRAQKRKLIKINIHDLRDYTQDRHKTVDDKPYGGGFGMVLMVKPIQKAVQAIKKPRRKVGIPTQKASGKRKVILLSAKGRKFDQRMAKRFSKLDQLIIISGRYEGVDERVAKYIADQEISIGDYVLTGGEVPAMVMVDAVTRLIPGVITKGSLEQESFPQYTRPESIKINNKQRKVPRVLLSGNHKKIEQWQEKHVKIFK
ncbi:MAG: tRNA (guanosine(37)-N1)-methyltransferase TrmD [Parcubacteria group bacterium]|jgi:tRNA (guanine37-N1)-methyltransferase|nr:tRNA (guanosine(37)-N1)-methyltransferase TrmD [Parcubacteria group bacterium]|tara:strand:- start:2110 stop:2778 length:669 start_codon:yes stop_codon:yes gene_type:complete